LGSIVEIAKKNNMPKDTILNAIKSHVNKKCDNFVKIAKIK